MNTMNSTTLKVGQVWHVTEAGKEFLTREDLSIADGGDTLTVDSIVLPEDGDMQQMMTQTTLAFSKGLLHKGESAPDRHDRFIKQLTDEGEDLSQYDFSSLLAGYTFLWSNGEEVYFELLIDATVH